jgi:hypothetical protein
MSTATASTTRRLKIQQAYKDCTCPACGETIRKGEDVVIVSRDVARHAAYSGRLYYVKTWRPQHAYACIELHTERYRLDERLAKVEATRETLRELVEDGSLPADKWASFEAWYEAEKGKVLAALDAFRAAHPGTPFAR